MRGSVSGTVCCACGGTLPRLPRLCLPPPVMADRAVGVRGTWTSSDRGPTGHIRLGCGCGLWCAPTPVRGSMCQSVRALSPATAAAWYGVGGMSLAQTLGALPIAVGLRPQVSAVLGDTCPVPPPPCVLLLFELVGFSRRWFVVVLFSEPVRPLASLFAWHWRSFLVAPLRRLSVARAGARSFRRACVSPPSRPVSSGPLTPRV
jgi:hypothetical protein